MTIVNFLLKQLIMEKVVFKMLVVMCTTSVVSQDHGFVTVAPEINLSVGQGILQMRDIESARGFGASLSFLENERISINTFYTLNRYSKMEAVDYAVVPEMGKKEVDITNVSGVATFGGLVRWSPEKLSTHVFRPSFGLGVGAAIHTSRWDLFRQDVIPHPLAGQTYQTTTETKGGGTVTNTHTYPQNQRLYHSDEGIIVRDGTMMGVAELGLNFNLSRKNSTLPRSRDFREGLVVFVNGRLEMGGRVDYRNAATNPHHFYYESGISESQNTPYSNLTPVEEIRSGPQRNLHQMFYLQFGIRKTIF